MPRFCVRSNFNVKDIPTLIGDKYPRWYFVQHKRKEDPKITLHECFYNVKSNIVKTVLATSFISKADADWMLKNIYLGLFCVFFRCISINVFQRKRESRINLDVRQVFRWQSDSLYFIDCTLNFFWRVFCVIGHESQHEFVITAVVSHVCFIVSWFVDV